MAHGTSGSSNVIYVKLKSKSDGVVDPHFELSIPTEDGERKQETVTWIEAEVAGIGTDSYEWKGDEVPTVVIVFRDGSQLYKMEASWGGLSRSLINSMLGIEKPGKLMMRVYTSNEGYANIYVENDGEKADWAHSWDKLSSLIETYKGKKNKEERDYTKLDERFAENVEEHLVPKYGTVEDAFANTRSEAPEEEPLGVVEDDEEIGDLPF